MNNGSLYNLAMEKIEKKDIVSMRQNLGGRQNYNYYMPCLTENVQHMVKHVKHFFPMEDLPQIFGLHMSATSAANSEFAHDIMNRVYEHQYIIKRTNTIDELQEKENTARYN